MVEILDFYAEWCGPCKMLSKTLEQIESEMEGLKIERVDVDSDDARVEKYGIQNLPTIIITEDGVVKERVVGNRSKNDLIEIFKQYVQ